MTAISEAQNFALNVFFYQASTVVRLVRAVVEVRDALRDVIGSDRPGAKRVFYTDQSVFEREAPHFQEREL